MVETPLTYAISGFFKSEYDISLVENLNMTENQNHQSPLDQSQVLKGKLILLGAVCF